MARRVEQYRAASRERRDASLAVRVGRSQLATRNSRLTALDGLTLIELLVTIVIMVTVLAGVIPLMSPNNNARKIREASRQLSSLMSQAQAQAARDGRRVGVAFNEFVTGTTRNGVALEAFIIAEPRPFAGFSESSRVQVGSATVGVYGDNIAAGENGGTLFPKYYHDDFDDIYQLTFMLGSDSANADILPPSTFRFGDIVDVDGRQFMVVDDEKDDDVPNEVDTSPESRMSRMLLSTNVLHCVWINRQPGQLPPQGAEFYRIRRQPADVPSKTSDAPLQFPRGIGIDLQASGLTGPDGLGKLDGNGTADLVAIMFGPDGALSSVHVNGTPRVSVDHVFLLMGAIENANNGSQDAMDYDFLQNPLDDRDELTQRRSRINWLNADSRWVTVSRSGRVVTSANNTSFDPSISPYIDTPLPTDPRDRADELRIRQLNGVGGAPGARAYAAQMQTEGGR